jgi:hypothetical protein
MTRQDFLKAGSTARTAVAFSQFTWPRAYAAEVAASPAPSWVDRPMGWAQLTLVEDDPGKIDLQFWLDFFKRARPRMNFPP